MRTILELRAKYLQLEGKTLQMLQLPAKPDESHSDRQRQTSLITQSIQDMDKALLDIILKGHLDHDNISQECALVRKFLLKKENPYLLSLRSKDPFLRNRTTDLAHGWFKDDTKIIFHSFSKLDREIIFTALTANGQLELILDDVTKQDSNLHIEIKREMARWSKNRLIEKSRQAILDAAVKILNEEVKPVSDTMPYEASLKELKAMLTLMERTVEKTSDKANVHDLQNALIAYYKGIFAVIAASDREKNSELEQDIEKFVHLMQGEPSVTFLSERQDTKLVLRTAFKISTDENRRALFKQNLDAVCRVLHSHDQLAPLLKQGFANIAIPIEIFDGMEQWLKAQPVSIEVTPLEQNRSAPPPPLTKLEMLREEDKKHLDDMAKRAAGNKLIKDAGREEIIRETLVPILIAIEAHKVDDPNTKIDVNNALNAFLRSHLKETYGVELINYASARKWTQRVFDSIKPHSDRKIFFDALQTYDRLDELIEMRSEDHVIPRPLIDEMRKWRAANPHPGLFAKPKSIEDLRAELMANTRFIKEQAFALSVANSEAYFLDYLKNLARAIILGHREGQPVKIESEALIREMFAEVPKDDDIRKAVATNLFKKLFRILKQDEKEILFGEIYKYSDWDRFFVDPQFLVLLPQDILASMHQWHEKTFAEIASTLTPLEDDEASIKLAQMRADRQDLLNTYTYWSKNIPPHSTIHDPMVVAKLNEFLKNSTKTCLDIIFFGKSVNKDIKNELKIFTQLLIQPKASIEDRVKLTQFMEVLIRGIAPSNHEILFEALYENGEWESLVSAAKKGHLLLPQYYLDIMEKWRKTHNLSSISNLKYPLGSFDDLIQKTSIKIQSYQDLDGITSSSAKDIKRQHELMDLVLRSHSKIILQGLVEDRDIRKYCAAFARCFFTSSWHERFPSEIATSTKIVRTFFKSAISESDKKLLFTTLNNNIDWGNNFEKSNRNRLLISNEILHEIQNLQKSNPTKTPANSLQETTVETPVAQAINPQPPNSEIQSATMLEKLMSENTTYEDLIQAYRANDTRYSVIDKTLGYTPSAMTNVIYDQVAMTLKIVLLGYSQGKDVLKECIRLEEGLILRATITEFEAARDGTRKAFADLQESDLDIIFSALHLNQKLESILKNADPFASLPSEVRDAAQQWYDEIKKWHEANTQKIETPEEKTNIAEEPNLTLLQKLRDERKELFRVSQEEGGLKPGEPLKDYAERLRNMLFRLEFVPYLIVIEAFKTNDPLIESDIKYGFLNRHLQSTRHQRKREGNTIEKCFNKLDRENLSVLFEALHKHGILEKLIHKDSEYVTVPRAIIFEMKKWLEKFERNAKQALTPLTETPAKEIIPEFDVTEEFKLSSNSEIQDLIKSDFATASIEHFEFRDETPETTEIAVTEAPTKGTLPEITNKMLVIEVDRLILDTEGEELGPTLPRKRKTSDEIVPIRLQPRIDWLTQIFQQDGFELKDMILYKAKEDEQEKFFENEIDQLNYEKSRYRILEVSKGSHYFQIAIAETVGRATYVIGEPLIIFKESDPIEVKELKKRRDVFQISCFNKEQFAREIRKCAYTHYLELQEQLKTRIGWGDKKDAVIEIFGNYYLETECLPATIGQSIIDLAPYYKPPQTAPNADGSETVLNTLTTWSRLYDALQSEAIAGLESIRTFKELRDHIFGPVGPIAILEKAAPLPEPKPVLEFDAKQVFREAVFYIKTFGDLPEHPEFERSLQNGKVKGLEELGIENEAAPQIQTTADFLIAAGIAARANDNTILLAPKATINQFARLMGLN